MSKPRDVSFRGRRGLLVALLLAAACFAPACHKKSSSTRGIVFKITTKRLAQATAGVAYSQTIKTEDGRAPYAFVVVVGALPPGLALNAVTGEVSGISTNNGSAVFVIRATDRDGKVADGLVTLVTGGAVAPPAVSAPTGALPDASQFADYLAGLSALDGAPPYVWDITIGALPPGLVLQIPTGWITGMPTTAGVFNFTVEVTEGGGGTSTRALSITVNLPVSIVEALLPDGTRLAAYTQALAMADGTPPFTWAIVDGSLPPGINLDPAIGMLDGTPLQEGTFTFDVEVTDFHSDTDVATFSILINPRLRITTFGVQGGTLTFPYSQTITVAGGTPPFDFAVSNPADMASGLALDDMSGVISGTPDVAEFATFTIVVTDAAAAVASRFYFLRISVLPTISTNVLSEGTVGAAYSHSLNVTGGTRPFIFTIDSGGLPAGLTLDMDTGEISGTPTGVEVANFTVKLVDVYTATTQKALMITINAAPNITTTALPNGAVGVSYVQTIVVTGGTAQLAFSIIAGMLPAGLALDMDTGVISGMPTGAEVANFTVQVDDANDATAQKALVITVN